MKIPKIIDTLRAGEPISDTGAAAAQLWLGGEGRDQDPDGSLRKAIVAHWESRPGPDPYEALLREREMCRGCGETYRIENLSICPNCLRTYCYRDNDLCKCGFKPVG